MTATSPFALTRRGLVGAGIAATFLGAPAFAAAPAGRKFVMIVARGGLDGLSLAAPVGDPDYARLRGAIALPADAVLRLDDTFGLHPKLPTLHRLAQAGQARIAPAVAIPERIRSHFEAQDLLESGGARLYAAKDGWLNRALAAGGGTRLKALSVGAQTPLILRGRNEAASWSPGGAAPAPSDRVTTLLQDLYAADPLLGPAFASGLRTEAMASQVTAGETPKPADVQGFATAAARFLTAPDGPQIAVLSLDGFDTHANQGGVEGQLANRLKILDQVLAGLESGLGPAWTDTVVVIATEFGRTARINGTGGLDHGTASTLVVAGGAVKPGGLIGDWPGLAENRLFENRDLAPTLDMRAVFKAVLTDHLGLDRRAVETTVFPDSAAVRPVAGLVA